MKKFYLVLIFVVFLFTLTGCIDEFNLNPPQKEVFEKNVNFSGEKKLQIVCKSGVSDLKIVPIFKKEDMKKLFKLEVIYDRANQHLVYDYKNSTLTVSLMGKVHRKFTSSITLFVTRKIPLEMKLRTGVGDSELDFSGLMIKNLSLKCGVGDTTIFCKIPNPIDCDTFVVKSGVGDLKINDMGNINCKNFSFIGGVGDCKLFVNGKWRGVINGTIKSGVGGINLIFPKDVGAELEVKGNEYTSSIKISDEYFEKVDKFLYKSKNYESEVKKVHFKVETGVGDVKVKVE